MARKISVLHFADKFGKAGATMHGVTRLLSWWFTRWDTSAFDMKLIGLRKDDPGLPRIREIVPDVIALERRILDPRTCLDMVRLIRETNADVVHLHGYAGCNFGRIAGRLTGTKIVLHEHFVDPQIPLHQVTADRLLAPFFDHAFAVSRSVRDFMIQKRHLAGDRIEVLYNGAPLDEFTPPPAEAVAAERRRWQIPQGNLVLGTVGRLDPQKGVRYLIESLPTLVNRVGNLSVLVVGDGPLRNELGELAVRLGVADHVIFTGYQSNIPMVQSVFDIQVFPSLYEGTPLTLFEAMGMRRPIASTNVDGLGEVLTNERNALVVPPADVPALTEAISTLLLDADTRHRIADQAGLDATQYDVSRMVERMQAVYQSLMS
jgi:glycosyltransferase involved in cell wall biosynthesis